MSIKNKLKAFCPPSANTFHSFALEVQANLRDVLEKTAFSEAMMHDLMERIASLETSVRCGNKEENIVEQNSTLSEVLVIFGCGEAGKEVLSWLTMTSYFEKGLIVYIDESAKTAPEKLECLGVPVLPPEKIAELRYDVVLIAGDNRDDALKMKEQLRRYGVPLFKTVDLSMLGYRDARYYFIRGFAEYVYQENLEGCVAECGVYLGDSAKLINLFFPDRRLYLFDTFEGFTQKDLNYERGLNNSEFLNGIFNNDSCFNIGGPEYAIELVKRKMTYPENVVIKKGYFPDSAVDVDAGEKFCFVNLDMDLYLPILNGLRFFWDKVVSGGSIAVHDYFRADLPGVRDAIRDFEAEKGIKLAKTPIGDRCSMLILKP